MDLNCPTCKSDNTQSLAQYVRAGSVSSEGVVIGGVQHAGLGAGLSSSKSSNEVIKRNPEPKPNSVIGQVMAVLFLSLIGFIFSNTFGYIMLIIAVVGGFSAYIDDKNKFPARLADFEAKWICLRCGGIFRPGGQGVTEPDKLG